jgi:RsiW-degrading membrane proteinase PrsW (M82 family)
MKLYITELLLMIIVSLVELTFGIIFFGKDDVCGKKENSSEKILQLPTWVIVNSAIEIIVVILLLSYNMRNETVSKLYLLYGISMMYFAWWVVGLYLYFDQQCLSGENIPSSVMIATCLIGGLILFYINMRIIDYLDHIRYTIHSSLEVPLFNNN